MPLFANGDFLLIDETEPRLYTAFVIHGALYFVIYLSD